VALVAAMPRGRWPVFQRAVVVKLDAVAGPWDRRRRADLAAGRLAEASELLGAAPPVQAPAAPDVAPESAKAGRPVGASAVLDVVAAEVKAVAPDVAAAEVTGAAPDVVAAEVAAAAPDVVAAEVAAAAPDVVAAEVVAAPDVVAAEVVVDPASAVVFAPSAGHFAALALPRRSLLAVQPGLVQALQPPRSFPPECTQAPRIACSAVYEHWI
jgi:hypothetical protein